MRPLDVEGGQQEAPLISDVQIPFAGSLGSSGGAKESDRANGDILSSHVNSNQHLSTIYMRLGQFSLSTFGQFSLFFHACHSLSGTVPSLWQCTHQCQTMAATA